MQLAKGISFRVAVYQARRLRLRLELAQLGRKIARLKAQHKTLSRVHLKRKPRRNNPSERVCSV